MTTPHNKDKKIWFLLATKASISENPIHRFQALSVYHFVKIVPLLPLLLLPLLLLSLLLLPYLFHLFHLTIVAAVKPSGYRMLLRYICRQIKTGHI